MHIGIVGFIDQVGGPVVYGVQGGVKETRRTGTSVDYTTQNL